MMNALFLLITLVGFTALSPLPSSALDRGRQALIKDTAAAEAMMATVENAVWAADGDARDKQIYVVYSTDCGWSKKLFSDARELGGRVQLRWIAAGMVEKGAGYVVSERSGAAVKKAFDGRPGSVNDASFGDRAVALNYAVMTSVSRQLQPYGKSPTFAYPTLLYRTAQGVRVISGNPPDLKRMALEVASRPDKSDLQPAGIEIAGAAVRTLPAPRLKVFLNNGKGAVGVYAFPDSRAPVLGELEPKFNLPITGVVEGKPWIAVSWSTKGPKAYVHAPLEARMARLEYSVKPAGGTLSARGKALEVRSHPVADAPLLDTLPEGYQLRKTGEVQLDGTVWDEVQLLSDGTPGYVAR